MKRRSKKWEFSKIILAAVMIIYVLTVIGSFIYFVVGNHPLDGLLNFVGTPTSVAIGFYAWKAKNENIRKNGKNYVESEDDNNAIG